MTCRSCIDPNYKEIYIMSKNDSLICEDCGNNTFNTKYIDNSPVGRVCRNCRAVIPVIEKKSIKKKQDNNTIDSEV